ncbi:MAG TPA: hypothetical protein EYP33_07585, partial [Pyrodictium sp.]|nr:hypothetical protein [Pyrodictium sp.]
GLGNTLAFYGSKFKCKKNLSKDEEAYKLVYEHIDGRFVTLPLWSLTAVAHPRLPGDS